LGEYVGKQRASLPATVVQIIANAGGVPIPEESDRERELRESREHQFDTFHEQVGQLPPAPLTRHSL
jgi:hypothetical protein